MAGSILTGSTVAAGHRAHNEGTGLAESSDTPGLMATNKSLDLPESVATAGPGAIQECYRLLGAKQRQGFRPSARARAGLPADRRVEVKC